MDGIIREPSQIVRRFSEHEETQGSDNPLLQSVVEQENQDKRTEKTKTEHLERWQELFFPPRHGALSELERSSRELAQTWEEFCKKLPNGHKWKATDRPPKLKDVYDEVDRAQQVLSSNESTSIMGKFRGLCNRLYDFKIVFEFVPNDDKYVSLVAGSITAIIKAAVHHKETMQGISSILDSLSDDMPYWQRLIELYPDNSFLKIILEQVYVEIFRFFIDVLNKWTRSSVKRFFGSFNSALKERNEARMKELDRLRDSMDREAGLNMMQTQRDIKESIEVNTLSLKQGQEGLEWTIREKSVDIETELTYMRKDIKKFGDVGAQLYQFLLQMGQNGQDFLRDSAKSSLSAKDARRSPGHSPRGSPSYTDIQDLVSESEDLSKEDVRCYLESLASSTYQDNWLRLREESRRLCIHEITLQKLRSWMTSVSSDMLWVSGESPEPTVSSNPRVAGYIANLLSASGLQASVVGYSCPFRRDIDSSSTGIQVAFMDVIKSLTLQLVESLPEDDIVLTSDRLTNLDDNFQTADTWIDILKTFVRKQPNQWVFVIIDGLDNFSFEPEVERKMSKLAEKLSPQHATERKKIVKVLFTTRLFCRGLSHLRPQQKFAIPAGRGRALEFGDVALRSALTARN